MTKGLCFCLALTLLLTAAVDASAAALHELANCRKTFSYSGGASAYFYGFYGSRLVSARVIPDAVTRTTDVSGNILCACHDDDNAYALYKESLHTYRVVQMNMNSGSCTHTEVAAGRTIQHTSLAAAADEAVVIVVENGVSYALGTRGKTEFTYRFAQNIDRLFVSGNAAYARLDGGAVYRLGNGQASLANGAAPYDNATAVAAAGKTATLQADYSVTVQAADAPQEPQASGGAGIAGEVLSAAAGTAVSQLKAQYPALTGVFDSAGNSVGSGKLKTGFSAQIGGRRYTIAVLGDVSGSGTVNSNDTNALMQFFTGSETLSDAARRAADFNSDDSVDHRDLVFIARAAS